MYSEKMIHNLNTLRESLIRLEGQDGETLAYFVDEHLAQRTQGAQS